jgi:hypothetical protein
MCRNLVANVCKESLNNSSLPVKGSSNPNYSPRSTVTTEWHRNLERLPQEGCDDEARKDGTTMTTVGIHAIEERYEPESEDGLSDGESDLPKPGSFESHRCRAASTRPNGVWFGPKGSEATERELISFLGSHNGVAVLQWPRDIGRSHRLRMLGIPRLWFVHDRDERPFARDKSEEWLPHAASDLEIHESLWRLCDWAATERSAVLPELEENGWLHLGDHGIQLTLPESCVAAPLVARFGAAVDDELLARRSARAAARMSGSLAGALHQLGRDVSALGLEVVPVAEHSHLIRRCR